MWRVILEIIRDILNWWRKRKECKRAEKERKAAADFLRMLERMSRNRVSSEDRDKHSNN